LFANYRGNRVAAANWGRLLWVTFLGKTRKVTSRRATPGELSAPVSTMLGCPSSTHPSHNKMDKWQIYTREAYKQIELAERSWSAFIDAEKREVVIEIFLHLQHFLSHTAMVDKILDPKEGSDRSKILKGHIDLTDIDLKLFRRLRNHLEHFDERLDKWVSNYDGHPFFDMNLVTGTQGFPEKAFLRALDSHIYKFHGESYDLDQLHSNLLEIKQRLSA
jgi:hypothetical protein